MQFIKTAFWVILAVAIALFSKANWTVAPTFSGYVPVKLWGDIVLEMRLPIMIILAFLLGLVPMWIYARATKWSMKRKLESSERALASAISPPTPPLAVSSDPHFASTSPLTPPLQSDT
jgi:lipopolysaccharide assembly protein A